MSDHDLLVDDSQIIDTMVVPMLDGITVLQHTGDILLGVSFGEPPDYFEICADGYLIKRFNYSADYYRLNLDLISTGFSVIYVMAFPITTGGTLHYGFFPHLERNKSTVYNPYLDSAYVNGSLTYPNNRRETIRNCKRKSNVLFIQP